MTAHHTSLSDLAPAVATSVLSFADNDKIVRFAYERLIINSSPLFPKFNCYATILGYDFSAVLGHSNGRLYADFYDLLHCRLSKFDFSSVLIADCFSDYGFFVHYEKFDELLNDLLTDAFIDIADKTSFLSDIRVFESVDFSDPHVVRIDLVSADSSLTYEFPYSSFYPLFRIFDAQSGLSLLDLLDKDVEQINQTGDHDLIDLLNGIFMQFGSR